MTGDTINKLCSTNGNDLAAQLPECVIDAELVASDENGMPYFTAIRRNHPNLCVWCFDLLGVAGKDIRSLPLVERREKLHDILIQSDDSALRFSEEFGDPIKLLATVDKMGLEGVVPKRRSSPYRSGTRSGWVKVKCASWRAANKDRGELFRRKGVA